MMTNSERRKAPRFALQLPGFIKTRKTRGESIRVVSGNISGKGTYVLSPIPLEPGQPVELNLKWQSENSELVTSGKITRVEELFGEQYGLAIEFFDSPSVVKAGKGVKTKDLTPLIFRTPELNEEAFERSTRLRKTKQYVDQRYSEEISLKKAAQIATMERTYFSSFFKQQVGVGFSNWLQHVRIMKAIELMQSRDYSISEIAYEVGFADLRTFQRAFRKITHTTPREFKKLVMPHAK